MAKPNTDYDDYWNEFQDIEKADDKDDHANEEEETSKTPDEGELEATWLRKAGYGHLTTSFEDGKLIDETLLKDEIESLTRTQAAAVRRRVNTLNATIRRKEFKRRDVRKVFNRPNELPKESRIPAHVPEEDHTPDTLSPPPLPTPTTPTSPGHGITRHGRKGSRDKLFRRSSGNYAMCGAMEEVQEGIEILNIHARTSGNKRGRIRSDGDRGVGLPLISDNDVMLDLKDDQSPLSPCAKLDVDHLGDEGKRTDADDDMPTFVLVKDNHGVTRIGDLGAQDMARCRSLALIELTALFDIYNIMYSKRKAKRKVKDTGLFGLPLQTLCEQDNKRNPQSETTSVPLVFKKIIHCIEETGLEVQGILRVPGSAIRIKNLRQQIDEKFQSGCFSWDGIRPNDAAALLKQFLRELPNPLLSNDYIEAFQQVENIPDKKQKLQALNLLILLLYDIHRDTLKVLVQFLRKVVDHRQHNMMTLSNVAMIIAPNLFHSCNKKSPANTAIEVSKAVGMSHVVKMLIKYQDILWTIPSFMITQIRHQYTSEQNRKCKEKSKINIFGKKPDKAEVYKKILETEPHDGFIRIQAPSLSKVGATVQLSDDITAGDIVDKFKKKTNNNDSSSANGHFAEDNAHLFEVGGNIGERCLDHSANMTSVYRVNPTAEWIIKNKPITV